MNNVTRVVTNCNPMPIILIGSCVTVLLCNVTKKVLHLLHFKEKEGL